MIKNKIARIINKTAAKFQWLFFLYKKSQCFYCFYQCISGKKFFLKTFKSFTTKVTKNFVYLLSFFAAQWQKKIKLVRLFTSKSSQRFFTKVTKLSVASVFLVPQWQKISSKKTSNCLLQTSQKAQCIFCFYQCISGKKLSPKNLQIVYYKGHKKLSVSFVFFVLQWQRKQQSNPIVIFPLSYSPRLLHLTYAPLHILMQSYFFDALQENQNKQDI